MEALGAIGGDSKFLLAALTAFLSSQRPVVRDHLSVQERRFLVESGTFTAAELAETERDVGKGSLQLRATTAFLSHLSASLTLEDAASYLGAAETSVREAAAEGELHAVEIAGELRFPAWQFNVGSPTKLLPGLNELIRAATSRRDWRSLAAFMETPQADLVAKGRKTPAAWLRDGGDVRAVTVKVEGGDWW